MNIRLFSGNERGDGLLILITYDVNTETPSGKSRLRKVAKLCVKYGQRVQNSVFECILDASQYVVMKSELKDIINEELDSLRFYRLGNNYKSQVEIIGKHLEYAQDGLLVL